VPTELTLWPRLHSIVVQHLFTSNFLYLIWWEADLMGVDLLYGKVDPMGVHHMRVGLMGIYLMGGDIDVSFATILCTTMTQEAHLGSKTFLCL